MILMFVWSENKYGKRCLICWHKKIVEKSKSLMLVPLATSIMDLQTLINDFNMCQYCPSKQQTTIHLS